MSDRLPGPVHPAKSLLSAIELSELTDLIRYLDRSGAEFTGTFRFCGRSIAVGYDAQEECHAIGGV